MDKELLRVVIVLIGLLVMIGMVLWHFIKSLRGRRDNDDYDDLDYRGEIDDEDDDKYDKPWVDEDDIDGDGGLTGSAIKPSPKIEIPHPATKSSASVAIRPRLIEFSIVARSNQGFNGRQLFDAFEGVGLEYGNVKVFERLDSNRMVHFAVASMDEPATFSNTGIDDYYCSGIVFFMQPRELDYPLAVFDDFVDTIETLAAELGGDVLDHKRQPLTAETIAQFRELMV